MKNAIVLAMLICVAVAHAQEEDEATTQPQRDRNEVRRGMEMGGSPEERARLFYERVISKVEPSLVGDVNNLHQYLELYKREFVEDTRTFAVSLHYGITGDAAAVVDGYVEFPEHKAALAEFFKHLKLTGVVDQTELLPSARLGEWRFGVITSPRAYVWDKPGSPDDRRERLTECVQGDTVYLLKNIEGHYLAHAPSGYVGFIAAGDLKPLNEKRLAEIESQMAVHRGSQIETMINAAHKLMGVKYVWGGTTSEGVDCSGLVYNAFKSIGVQMPRDADQQFLVGRLVGTRWHRSALRRGDLLYFLSRRGTISHTAIYLGDNKYIEASGSVKITSFNASDAEYNERRDKSFCFAKRVIE